MENIYSKGEKKPLYFNFKSNQVHLSELMFCLCLIGIFLPIKIYPFIFLLSSLLFYWETNYWIVKRWLWFITVFILYATVSFIINYDAQNAITTNWIKMLVNFSFFYLAVNWIAQRDNRQLIPYIDMVLHLIFILVLIQLLIYHQALDFKLIWGSSSSSEASVLYNKSLYFWGLEDKNMFGARIAVLGFPYILIPLIRYDRISWGRILFVFLLAYLSLSRTPILALLIGLIYLVWVSTDLRRKIIMILLTGISVPFIMVKLIRVNNLAASNDGMGVRITYWKAFFENFSNISPFGNGFMKAPEFLSQYAVYYHGEPHIHNTFLSAYLELGIIGLLSYTLFLLFFFLYCTEKFKNLSYWTMAFLPILSIMMILYSGYDNDIVIYFTLVFLLGNSRPVNFKSVKMFLI